ncbi:MAG: sulfatase [Pseudomonadota bacterium]
MPVLPALRDRLRGAFAGAWAVVFAAGLSAGAYGLVEALRVRAGGGFLREGSHSWLLLALGALSLLPVGLAAGLLVGPFIGRLGRTRRLWAGASAGLAVALAWDLAQRWFTDPGPAGGLPLQGNTAVFVVFAALLAAAWGLALWRLEGWRGMGVGFALLVVALGTWYATGLPAGVERGVPRGGAPNVLWVTLDTVRADHTSTYGGRADTPALQRVADGGILYERAFSPIAVTGPSHTTMLTGAGPWRTGTLLNGVPILPELSTLPETLQAAGYRTAGFVSAWVLDSQMGFDRGFDLYDDELGWLPGLDDLLFFRSLAMLQRHFSPDTVVERRGDRTTERALTWLSARREPFFLWVHLFDPHGPYEPPPPFDGMYWQGGDPRGEGPTVIERHEVAPYLRASLRGVTSEEWVVAQYDGEIAFADQQLGRLLDALEERGLAENTLVVVNADHGEDLGEHDIWFEHGDSLYDSSTHVPLVLRLPHGELAGTSVADPVELSDIAPTILDYLGLQAPASMQGSSLRDAMSGTGHRLQARGLCLDRVANQASRAAGKPASWRMASLRAPMSLFVHRDSPDHPDEYYDLAADPGGARDVLEERLQDPDGGQLMGLLAQQADGLLKGMGQDLVERSNAELTAEQTEALKMLGYIDE